VNAEWDTTGWWIVTVPDVPGAITQCRRLDQVAADAAEVIEIQTGDEVKPGDLDFQTAPPHGSKLSG
jgi:predicted RNase H-like HicB family nuclease